MIGQMVQVTLGSTVCDFGKGDIAVGVGLLDNNKVHITMSNMEKAQEIGSNVSSDNCANPAVILQFDNIDSINTVKTAFEKAVEILTKKIEDAKIPEKPEFVVPFDKLYVSNAFKCTNPAASKIIACMKHFQETKELDRDIVVSKNLMVTDGYVGYLVAKDNGFTKIRVAAPEGIDINIGKVVTFKSDKIAVSFGLIKDSNGENAAFNLVLNTCGERHEIPAETIEDAVAILKKINKVFDAHYTIYHTSTFNIGLYEKMKECKMDVEIASK